MITCLRFAQTETHMGEFYIEDDDKGYYDTDETEIEEERWFCPTCGAKLFENEDDAERFLLSRRWVPGVLPNAPKDPNNLRTWTDEELREDCLGLYDAIFLAECYSSSDYTNYLSMVTELSRRGIILRERAEFVQE